MGWTCESERQIERAQEEFGIHRSKRGKLFFPIRVGEVSATRAPLSPARVRPTVLLCKRLVARLSDLSESAEGAVRSQLLAAVAVAGNMLCLLAILKN
ncbi:hypothetical protein SAY86_007812 [Trapa natans]|uniref:Uncharacterized protein n=1 Tax=Trapa natans TaxID=22666 RepID=A0AAN7R2I6_TRANT|nr:hypothetical protein SAY86_007812 [Trapa natans]